MRRAALSACLLSACIPNFALEGRRFRCDPTSPIACGEGLVCSTEGYCEEPVPRDAGTPRDAGPAPAGAPVADAGPAPDASPSQDAEPADTADAAMEVCDNGRDDDGDDTIDCADPDCGVGVCDRFAENLCIDDLCTSDGRCTSRFNTAEDLAAGWRCENGVRHELACDDRLDNDGDSARDCADDDCTPCAFPLNCCGTGECLALCQ